MWQRRKVTPLYCPLRDFVFVRATVLYWKYRKAWARIKVAGSRSCSTSVAPDLKAEEERMAQAKSSEFISFPFIDDQIS